MYIDDFALKKRHTYGTVMIDIETHQIIDMIDSKVEYDVTKWLKSYPNLKVISRDEGIMYKSSSDKSHPKAEQISNKFHVLKNLTKYDKDALKRLLHRQIKITEENSSEAISKIQKKYERISMQELKSQISKNNKWKLIQEVQIEYKKCHKYSVVGKKFNIDDRTVKKYLEIKEAPTNGNKSREYASKLSLYKNE